jgi:hypothetical protein
MGNLVFQTQWTKGVIQTLKHHHLLRKLMFEFPIDRCSKHRVRHRQVQVHQLKQLILNHHRLSQQSMIKFSTNRRPKRLVILGINSQVDEDHLDIFRSMTQAEL